MKITVESTNEILQIDGKPCRMWRGLTEHETPVEIAVFRIAPLNPENTVDTLHFETEMRAAGFIPPDDPRRRAEHIHKYGTEPG